MFFAPFYHNLFPEGPVLKDLNFLGPLLHYRVVIWHIFFEIWDKVKNFLRLCHLYSKHCEIKYDKLYVDNEVYVWSDKQHKIERISPSHHRSIPHTSQGDLLRGIDNKTVRRLHPLFTYLFSSVKWKRFKKIALIPSHHLHLQWKFKLWAGKV